MHQSDDLVSGERRLDLGKPGDYLTGLAGDRQGLERRARNKPLREVGKVRRNADILVEAAGENLALDRLGDRSP